MKSKFVSMVPAITLIMAGSWGVACADTSEVKLPSPVIVAKTGKHCKDDPHCFNRYHYSIKPAAHVAPGQLFVLETRDALDSDLTFNSKPQDVAAVNLNLVHPLTGPVFVDGAKRGDAIAVTIVDIAPDDFGYTTIVPGFGFLRDVFRDPFIIHWELNRLEARSKDLPGISVPMNAFMGTVGVLPGKPEIDKWLKREKALADAGGAALTPQPVDALPSDLCGTSGTAKDECVRTVPPRENGGNLDTKETVVGTTLLFPCFIDGCGLFAGDVHYAQGGGEVCGTAIEMGAKVTMRATIMPGRASLLSTMHFEGGAQLKHLAPGSFYAVSGLPLKPEGEVPVFDTYLGGQKIAPLANLSEDVSLAARNATLNMIDFLVKEKGLEPRTGLYGGERGRRSQHRAIGGRAEPGCHGDPQPRHLQAVTERRAGAATIAAAPDAGAYESACVVDVGCGSSGRCGLCARRARPALADLNPDRMWPVYRRYHLLIVSQRDDERNGALTTAVVDVLVAPSARISPSARQCGGRAAHRRSHRDRSAGCRDHAGRQRRGALSCQAAVRRHPRSAATHHRLVRQLRFRLPPGFHGPARLPAGADALRPCGGPSCRRHRAGRRRARASRCARLLRRRRDAE